MMSHYVGEVPPSAVIHSAYHNLPPQVGMDWLDDEGNPVVNPTEQNHKDFVDINNVLKRYDSTGLITHVNNMAAAYGDYSEVNEYREALDLVREAQESFMSLPSEVRNRFANDPGAFLEFVTDPSNLDELRDMGLAKQPPGQPDPVRVTMVNPDDGDAPAASKKPAAKAKGSGTSSAT